MKIIRDGYKIDIEGHAGYGAYGTDIVCAAASMLFYTLAQTLNARSVDGFKVSESGDETIRRVECAPSADEREAVSVVYETIMHGFTALASSYPEYVSLNEVHHESNHD